MRLPELPTREASVCSSPSSKRRVPSALRAKVQELNPNSGHRIANIVYLAFA